MKICTIAINYNYNYNYVIIYIIIIIIIIIIVTRNHYRMALEFGLSFVIRSK